MEITWLARLVLLGLALTAPVITHADSAEFNIPAQPMPLALKTFAAQAHMQLLYQYEAVAHAKGNAVVGDLDKHAALQQLLKNSGLEAVYTSESAATIRRVNFAPAGLLSRNALSISTRYSTTPMWSERRSASGGLSSLGSYAAVGRTEFEALGCPLCLGRSGRAEV